MAILTASSFIARHANNQSATSQTVTFEPELELPPGTLILVFVGVTSAHETMVLGGGLGSPTLVAEASSGSTRSTVRAYSAVKTSGSNVGLTIEAYKVEFGDLFLSAFAFIDDAHVQTPTLSAGAQVTSFPFSTSLGNAPAPEVNGDGNFLFVYTVINSGPNKNFTDPPYTIYNDVTHDNAGARRAVVHGVAYTNPASLNPIPLGFTRTDATNMNYQTVVVSVTPGSDYDPGGPGGPGGEGTAWHWNGSTAEEVEVLGVWNGSSLEPVEFLGVWNGSSLEPIE